MSNTKNVIGAIALKARETMMSQDKNGNETCIIVGTVKCVYARKSQAR